MFGDIFKSFKREYREYMKNLWRIYKEYIEKKESSLFDLMSDSQTFHHPQVLGGN